MSIESFTISDYDAYFRSLTDDASQPKTSSCEKVFSFPHPTDGNHIGIERDAFKDECRPDREALFNALEKHVLPKEFSRMNFKQIDECYRICICFHQSCKRNEIPDKELCDVQLNLLKQFSKTLSIYDPCMRSECKRQEDLELARQILKKFELNVTQNDNNSFATHASTIIAEAQQRIYKHFARIIDHSFIILQITEYKSSSYDLSLRDLQKIYSLSEEDLCEIAKHIQNIKMDSTSDLATFMPYFRQPVSLFLPIRGKLQVSMEFLPETSGKKYSLMFRDNSALDLSPFDSNTEIYCCNCKIIKSPKPDVKLIICKA